VTYLPVKSNGLIDLKQLEEAMRDDTAIVSVMAVNNEIGVVQPLAEIGKLCRSRKIFFHTDAAQAVGKIPVDVNAMNIDCLSISGHKMYGPKGIGAVYVRRRPRLRMEALISGGGQERGLRSGTLPTPLVVGLGAAAKIAAEEMRSDEAHVQKLAKRLVDGITSQCANTQINGDETARYPGNVNMSFAYVEGESLLMGLKEIAVSSGERVHLGVARALVRAPRARRGRGDGAHEHPLRAGAVQHGGGGGPGGGAHGGARREAARDVAAVGDGAGGIDLKSIQWSQH
jgi:cysteine desulfurase